MLRGIQEPRISCSPKSFGSSGDEVADFAAMHGLVLDPWQRLVLREALGEQADGRWAAFEVGLMVPRQNGKGSILEARELGGLFLLGERLIIHTAHQFKTSAEAYLRIKNIIDGSDDLSKRVKRMYSSPADTGIDLKNGNRLKFIARAVNGSGRGFTGDLVIMDEAYRLPSEAMEALMPTLTARPNPQIWYTSSAGYGDSTVLASIRKRGEEGSNQSLAYLEWSAPEDCDLDDHNAWARANPALGFRITEEAIQRNRDAFTDNPTGFGREHLGIWEGEGGVSLIAEQDWARGFDVDSHIISRPTFALDVSPARTWAAIGASGTNRAGRLHIEITERAEVVDHRERTEWVIPRLKELKASFPSLKLYIAQGSAAMSLKPEIEALGITVEVVPTAEVVAACGKLFDLITAPTSGIAHLGTPELTEAVRVVKKQQEDGERAFVWGRKRSAADITPLYAVTIAAWAAFQKQTAHYDIRDSFL